MEESVIEHLLLTKFGGKGPERKNRAEKGRARVQQTRVPEKGCPRKGEKGPEKG